MVCAAAMGSESACSFSSEIHRKLGGLYCSISPRSRTCGLLILNVSSSQREKKGKVVSDAVAVDDNFMVGSPNV